MRQVRKEVRKMDVKSIMEALRGWLEEMGPCARTMAEPELMEWACENCKHKCGEYDWDRYPVD